MTQIGNVQLDHILAIYADFLLWYLHFGTKPINGQNLSYHILAPNRLLFYYSCPYLANKFGMPIF
jgi:hypothetical protein